EIFAYGGANWAQVIPVLQELQGAQQFGRLGALLSGQIGQADQSKAQARAMLAALNESRDKLQVPELVIGLRTTKKGAAAAQIKRVEDLLAHVADRNPGLKGRVKRVTTGGADMLTLTLDGSMVPWDKVPFEEIEETKGQFQDLVAKLKARTLSVTLAVKKDSLPVSVRRSAGVLDRLGS